MVVGALAVTSGLQAPRRSLGAALAEAGLSELRLTRLLRAHAGALPAEVRAVASYLASKAVPFDATDLARLVLSDGGPSEERVRRGIARSYYGQLSRNKH
jgi:CRISPR type I-E-associated protein CasB/Cse2